MPGGQIKVFWLEPTDLVRVWARRYVPSGDYRWCSKRMGLGCEAWRLHLEQAPREDWPASRAASEKEGMAFPETCSHCKGAFPAGSIHQVFVSSLFSGAPDGKLYTLREAPVGSMWDADWLPNELAGPDGIHLVVKTPGGEWMVDSKATNCTRPDEDHECWVRHGDPRTGTVHVDKQGNTCSAGAGSISMGGYHGFLHHGFLTNA